MSKAEGSKQEAVGRTARDYPLFLIDGSGMTEVRIPLADGRGYFKVIGRGEFVYDDNPAASFKYGDQ